MINVMKVHDNWLLHTVKKPPDALFSDEQLNLLHSFFTEETLPFVTSILQQKWTDLEVNRLAQLEIPPFQFLLLKEPEHSVIALSLTRELLPGVSAEEDGASMDATFIARSPKMKDLMEIVKKISYVDSTVLLLGKSGTGKSVIAKLIHKYSNRAGKSFISINCGAIPEALMEAELFGYSHGSFTGGQRGGKKGIFEAAHEGTVFLDEIGELPLNLQVKLLEVLQENSIRPIGATQQVPVNVRVIAATNQNLLELVAQKKFREDLYYRLNVVPILIPPLHERREDIIHLIRYFLDQKVRKYGIYRTLHPEVEHVLQQYDFPGNVRELENLIERLIITTEESEIQLKHLPPSFHPFVPAAAASNDRTGIMSLKEAKKNVEKDLITRAYAMYKSSYKVAQALGVDQSTIAKKLKEYRVLQGEES
ncbi:MAG: sigma-54 interaction domain-containing protein [Clostridia bacterium]